MGKKKKYKVDSNFLSLLDCKLDFKKVPVIYRKEHNISFFGFEKLHPFDSCKYKNVKEKLIKFKLFTSKNLLYGKMCSTKQLLELHDKKYLSKLKDLKEVGKIIEIDLASIITKIPLLSKLNPASIVEKVIINGFKWQVGSTILAGEVARLYGYSIVLGGGMHHASSNSGGGWCMFGDIQLSILNLKKQKKVKKVLIIDLDAHQGNGYETDKENGKLGDKKDTYIIDVYNKNNYPGDTYAKRAININIGITRKTSNDEYINIIKSALERGQKEFGSPDIVYYNAGTDCLIGDTLGGLKVTAKGIQKRDKIVMQFYMSKNVPVVYLLSGGYMKSTADVIADSIYGLFIDLKLKEVGEKNFKKNIQTKEWKEWKIETGNEITPMSPISHIDNKKNPNVLFKKHRMVGIGSNSFSEVSGYGKNQDYLDDDALLQIAIKESLEMEKRNKKDLKKEEIQVEVKKEQTLKCEFCKDEQKSKEELINHVLYKHSDIGETKLNNFLTKFM